MSKFKIGDRVTIWCINSDAFFENMRTGRFNMDALIEEYTCTSVGTVVGLMDNSEINVIVREGCKIPVWYKVRIEDGYKEEGEDEVVQPEEYMKLYEEGDLIDI